MSPQGKGMGGSNIAAREKAPLPSDSPPIYFNSSPGSQHAPGTVHDRMDEDWWTRNGLNLRSFQRRDDGHGPAQLDRTMKSRHLHMIAIGGSIGAGFFVGSGGALRTGGPGAVLIDFMIIGIMMFNTVYALGELAVMFPVSGAFYTYSTRFVDPSWGFAMGWNYIFQWIAVLPLELTVCGLTIQYWLPDTNVGIWITVFLASIIVINIFGTLGYAEEEFCSSIIKLGATIVFMITAFVLVLGGGPSNGQYSTYQGAKLWQDPGAFANGFRGFCSVFVTAAFSFSGTELVGLAAAEARNPLKSLPGAIKQVFWRISLFYILGLSFVGLLIPQNDPRLIGQNTYADVNASPFVLVGKYAGLTGFDSFMNFIILVSVLSIGVSAVYAGSRTLTALAEQGYGPKFLTYIDRSGRPLVSVSILIASGLLAYLNLLTAGTEIFDWMLAISGLAALFTWGSVCFAHIRFRKAWAYHGHTLDEIPFKALGGVYGSWLGLILIAMTLIAQLYIAICPVEKEGFNTVTGFFKSYLAVFVVILFWACGYFWKRTSWLKIEDIDVDTGRRELPWDEIHEYRAQLAAMPSWKRIVHVIFI